MTLEGKPVAEKILKELEPKSQKGLAVILVGENPISLSYVEAKEEIAKRLGISFKLYHLPGFSSQKEIEKLILDLNRNKFIQGIVVQLPLAKNLNVDEILQKIDPKKDIDGFSGRFPYPTVEAIFEIFKFYNIDIMQKKKVVVVGKGRLVGSPLAKRLNEMGIRPIICDKSTENLAQETLKADIVISATGVAGLIEPEMVLEKAIIIDAGSSEISGDIVGDVDKEVYKKVKSYSPVPGGVGPVTVACLMRNLFKTTKEIEEG